MKKYTLYIDYKKTYSFHYETLEAKTLEEAIKEADKKMSNEIYLMRVMEKTGNIERNSGRKCTKYKAIICNRGNGWHINDKEHGENYHAVEHIEYKYSDVWYTM